MGIADDLNGAGYFPRELPPPFTTKPFAARVYANRAHLPRDFRDNSRKYGHKVFQLTKYSTARSGPVRRMLAIPNPLVFSQLSEAIDSDWANLRVLAGSPISRSVPRLDVSGQRALAWRFGSRRIDTDRIRSRRRGRYLVKADLADFYQSIYTHGIPWALHTKAAAKANRTPKLLGNRLDQWIRNSNGAQTSGIPIGPDSSLLIAEILLSTIDRELLSRRRGLAEIRVSDDYEIACGTYSDAEATLAELQAVLAEYELRLNPAKTEIVELPQPLERAWVREIRSLPLRPGAAAQRRDLLHLYDVVSESIGRAKDDHVAAFVIGRLRRSALESRNWVLIQSMLSEWMLADPSITSVVVELLTSRVRIGWQVDRQLWRESFGRLIRDALPLQHVGEAAWALWGCIELDIRLAASTIRAVCANENPVIALLALDAHSQGLITGAAFDSTLWQARVDAPELRTESWLLAYEANFKTWLPNRGGVDFVALDPAFGFLKNHGVYFYDQNAKASYGAWASQRVVLTPRAPTLGGYAP